MKAWATDGRTVVEFEVGCGLLVESWQDVKEPAAEKYENRCSGAKRGWAKRRQNAEERKRV